MTIFIGLDPGLSKTGWGIVAKEKSQFLYLGSGIINTKKNDLIDPIQYRLREIFDVLNQIILQYKPIHASIENTYVNVNYKSSLQLAHARAVAILACDMHNLSVAEYQAKTIKKTLTSTGSADKEQVKKMLSLYLKGVQNIKIGDETDAIAIALCHAIMIN